jgi:hypothetical protein
LSKDLERRIKNLDNRMNIHHVHFDDKDILKREIIELNKEWTKTDPSFRMLRMSLKSAVVVDEFNMLDSMSEEELYEELQRFYRMGEIQDKANDARIARIEAESSKRRYSETRDFVSGDEYVDWSLNDEEKQKPIEEEYNALSKKQHDIAWLREFGKPYRIEDDPNAKF